MAARRLVIVMLLLLGVSTLLASLAPPPGQRGRDASSTSSSTTTATESRNSGGGQLVRAEIDAQARDPQRIEVPRGDQLSLQVTSDRVAEVRIALLGLLDTAAPLSPARFDILASEDGRYSVTLRDERDRASVIGEILVVRD